MWGSSDGADWQRKKIRWKKKGSVHKEKKRSLFPSL